MEEEALTLAENLTQDGVLDLITDFPLVPTRAKLIITVNTSEDVSDDGVRISNNELSETQYVMSAGPHVQDIKPGQKVLLNIERMMDLRSDRYNAEEQVGSIKLRPVTVNGRIYALIDDGVIDAKDFR